MVRITELGTAVIAMVMVGWVVSPRNNTAKVIDAMGGAFAGSINAAMGGATFVAPDTRTPAEKFHDEAIEAIGDFWAGQYE